MKRLTRLLMVSVMLAGLAVAASPTPAAAAVDTTTAPCVTVPVSTPPVWVDINNDGRPEFYMGSVGNPGVCVEGGLDLATFLPEAGSCGTGCVYLKVTILPAYVGTSGSVTISYTYNGYSYSHSIPIDDGLYWDAPNTICIKIGGTGPC